MAILELQTAIRGADVALDDELADAMRCRIPMSRAEFYALPEGPPFYEWARGEAVQMNSPLWGHQRVVVKLMELFEGLAGVEVGFSYDVDMPNSVRIPDVLVVEPWPSDAPRLTVPPLVVVEVLSPSTRATDLTDKRDEYLQFGVGQYWIVDPVAASILIQQNVGEHWEPLVTLTRDNPVAAIEVDKHGTVTPNINAIIPVIES